MAPAGTRQERKADPSLLRRAGTNVRHPPSPRLRRAGGMTTGRMCRTYGAPEKHLKTIIVRPRTQGSRLRQTPSAATARQARPGLGCSAPTGLVIECGAILVWSGGAGCWTRDEERCQPEGWRYRGHGENGRRRKKVKNRTLKSEGCGTRHDANRAIGAPRGRAPRLRSGLRCA